MQLRTRTWFLISLLCLVGAGIFWHLGNKHEERRRQQLKQQPAATNALQKPEIVKELGALNFAQSSPLTGFGNTNQFTSHVSLSTNHVSVPTNAFSRSNLLSYRVTNTAKPIGELTHVESALLLRNALIDNTPGSQPVSIPEHLRSSGDPGAYVVQANGYLDDTFRSYLKAAEGEIITYLPNNAYLVRFSEQGAAKMRSYRGTLAVLPWEPYYKLDLRLLPAAVHGDALPQGTYLNVLLFPGERESGIQAIEALGARVELEQRSPFGHQLTIAAAPDSLTKLAQLTTVQGIEPYVRRATANDLGRARIGAATKWDPLESTCRHASLSIL